MNRRDFLTLQDLRDKVAAGAATRVEVENAALLLFGGDARGVDVGAAYNGSKDAASALHDAMLPGWGWELSYDAGASVWRKDRIEGPASIREPITVRLSDGEWDDARPVSRAWLLAQLDALIHEERG